MEVNPGLYYWTLTRAYNQQTTTKQYKHFGNHNYIHIVYLRVHQENPNHDHNIKENDNPAPITFPVIRVSQMVQNWSFEMSKREIIDMILEINRGAKAEFLAQFDKEELDLYLEHLMDIDLKEISLVA
jgi:CRISPR/Cas system endoribonuclease Cas6 (RAMP superfamily)